MTNCPHSKTKYTCPDFHEKLGLPADASPEQIAQALIKFLAGDASPEDKQALILGMLAALEAVTEETKRLAARVEELEKALGEDCGVNVGHFLAYADNSPSPVVTKLGPPIDGTPARKGDMDAELKRKLEAVLYRLPRFVAVPLALLLVALAGCIVAMLACSLPVTLVCLWGRRQVMEWRERRMLERALLASGLRELHAQQAGPDAHRPLERS